MNRIDLLCNLGSLALRTELSAAMEGTMRIQSANESWPGIEPLIVEEGKRYCLIFRNGSDGQHPVYRHRHRFEVGQLAIAGLADSLNLMQLRAIAVDFIAVNRDDTLWHYHQQSDMDLGFMQLIHYEEEA